MSLPPGWTSRIREFRMKLPREDSTQKKIAEQLGVSLSHYCEIEKGKVNPSVTLAIELAELFGVSVSDLYSRKN